jgi:hypothetical protein
MVCSACAKRWRSTALSTRRVVRANIICPGPLRGKADSRTGASPWHQRGRDGQKCYAQGNGGCRVHYHRRCGGICRALRIIPSQCPNWSVCSHQSRLAYAVSVTLAANRAIETIAPSAYIHVTRRRREMAKILVLYYSMYNHIETLARGRGRCAKSRQYAS